MLKIEYSSMAFTISNYKEKIEAAKNFLDKQNIKFGIQIHNSIEKNLYDKLLEYKNNIEFSIHSPIFSKYFLNLASNNIEQILEICDNCIKYLDLFNTKLFFFHSLFMTEKPIIMDMANYRKTMLDSIGTKYCLNNSFIMDPSFFKTDEFYKYKEIFKKNYSIIKEKYNNYLISLENDFVGVGSGLQRPDEIFELIDNLYFDAGHMWCSSLVSKFDYLEISKELINKKHITGAHIQRNLYSKNDPVEKIYDSHTHLYNESEHPLKETVRLLYDKGLRVFTLEIIDGDLQDIKTFLDYL